MDIKLSKTGEKLDPELFNGIARNAAKEVASGGDGMDKYKGNYRVALFCHLYQHRD
jgi:hypothetical protein